MVFLQQNAHVLDNIVCLNAFEDANINTQTPTRHMTTERLMHLINSNNFRFKKMCALATTIVSIALATILGFSAAPIAAATFGICAVVSLAYFIKVRLDQKKWVADVNAEVAIVGQIFRKMADFFVATRKVREEEMFKLIKDNQGLVVKEIHDRENIGGEIGVPMLVQNSWKLAELQADNEKRYEFLAAKRIKSMPLPQWKPFNPALIQDWDILKLACSRYMEPKPNDKLYVNVEVDATGSLLLSPHPQDTPCMK